ncbi:hypothetical protein GCM10010841_14490 [Deinococcus aerophilus]|uniref:Secreted protein n=1 Tax=Deinococcus aerophilus TaxID=522488 RepID=A0ABQ2GQW9_9DEIO|nr:hypothetical protein GCM10010841_14490 [Deinococcus aerophilus]
MRTVLSTLLAVLRAASLGVIGQPDGGPGARDRARKARQHQRVRRQRPSSVLQTIGTLTRAAAAALTFQPDDPPTDGDTSPASKRRPRR